MEDSAVDIENEFLYLAGTGKRVAVSARGPLGLTDGKPLGVFRPLKVREVAFRSRESIAGRYRVPEEFEKDILTPAHSDQTMEEFLRLQSRDDSVNLTVWQLANGILWID